MHPLYDETPIHTLFLTLIAKNSVMRVSNVFGSRPIDMKTKHNTISIPVLCGFLSVFSANATTFTVSPSGSDDHPGTAEKPFHTISRAAAKARPGDTVQIMGGIYRESVVLKTAGTAEQPVRFIGETSADGSPAVLLDGTEPINTTWTSTKVNGHAAYWTPLDTPIQQLFLNGVMMTEARWPDQPFSHIWDRTTWAKSEKGSQQDRMVCATLAETGVDWTGAWATLNVGQQFQTWSRIVTAHEKGSPSFSYDLAKRPNNDVSDGPTWWDDNFYLRGKIEALTAPAEWFHDAQRSRLYFIPPSNRAPSPGEVTIKTRIYGMEGRNVNHIQISGLHFFGCTFQFQNSDHLLIENSSVLYPNYAPVLTDTLPKGERAPIAQTTIRGNDNIVRNVSIAYGNTAGISMTGSRNRLENCVIHDFCWEGNLHHPAVSLRSVGKAPCDSTISRCTIYNSGNMGIWYLNENNVIKFNEVYNTGLACKDIAAIQTGSPNTTGSIAHHNWIHDSKGKGIRGDDQTRGLTFHHNVIWNCDEGMILKGEDNQCFNNTIIGSDGHGCLIIPTRPEPRKWWSKTEFLDRQNTRSAFHNNLVESIAYRHEPLEAEGVRNNLETKDGAAFAKLLVDPDQRDFRPRKDSLRAGAYAYGEKPWRPGADWTDKPIDIEFIINTEVARAGHRETGRGKIVVRLPARLLDSNLSELSKNKLQVLYNDCWTAKKVETRQRLIQQKNQLPESARERTALQKQIVALHRAAGDRLKERAGEVLAGSEHTIFLSAY